MLRWRASDQLVGYQREVDKGKLTAVVSFDVIIDDGKVCN